MTEQEWLTSTDPAAMLQHLTHQRIPTYTPDGVRVGSLEQERLDGPPPRKVRLFACACCRQVWDGVSCLSCLGNSKRYVIDSHCLVCHGTGKVSGLTDPRSRLAVEVSERFADGEATREELDAAHRSAHFNRADRWEGLARRCSWSTDFTGTNPYFPEETTSNHLCISRDCGVPPATQTAILRDIFGNPFRPSPELWRPCPVCWCSKLPVGSFECSGCRRYGNRRVVPGPVLRWNDGTVPSLARRVYDERAWHLMPVLGDALLDAGADDAAILDHCREPLHARGCWALDLILGKE